MGLAGTGTRQGANGTDGDDVALGLNSGASTLISMGDSLSLHSLVSFFGSFVELGDPTDVPEEPDAVELLEDSPEPSL